MNNLILGLVLLAGAAIAGGSIYIGNKAAEARRDKEEMIRRQKELEALKKDSDRRKEANEQKESMETGSNAADFDASINVINQLRNKKPARS